MTKPVQIDVEDKPVSALWLAPPKAHAAYVFAHGAGAGMTHMSMSTIADGLAERGIASLRYQFPYMEAGSKRPDTPKLCHATVRAAVADVEHRDAGSASGVVTAGYQVGGVLGLAVITTVSTSLTTDLVARGVSMQQALVDGADAWQARWGRIFGEFAESRVALAALLCVVLLVVLAILAPILARLVQLAISRQREYLADASGVELTRNPVGLEQALAKIAQARSRSASVSTPGGNGTGVVATAMRCPASSTRSCSRASSISSRPGGSVVKVRRKPAR